MTPRERAEQIVATWIDGPDDIEADAPILRDAIESALLAAEAQGQAEERARCVGIAKATAAHWREHAALLTDAHEKQYRELVLDRSMTAEGMVRLLAAIPKPFEEREP